MIRKYRKPLGILFLLYLIGALGFLAADFYFRDDLRRAAIGFRGWGVGRYLSLLFSVILHTDTYLADISPLPQLLALAILAVTAVALRWICKQAIAKPAGRIAAGEDAFSIWEYAALFSLAFFPHFLNCLSYKYDAPYMALSVCVSVLPLLWRDRKPSHYAAAVFAGTLAMCMLYQASSGIFPVLVIFLTLMEWLGGGGEKAQRSGLRFLLRSALPYCVAMLLFRLVIMRPSVDEYISTDLPEKGRLITTILSNYTKYLQQFMIDMRPLWLFLLGMITALFVVCVVMTARRNKAAALLMTILSLAAMFILSLGAYPLLAKPLFLPRAMYGLGFPFCLMGLALVMIRKESLKSGPQHEVNILFILPVAALSFCFLVFAYTYGNALSVQARYTDYRATLALADLNDLPAFVNSEEKQLEISGNIGYSPLIEAMPEDYTLLRRLVPLTLGSGNMWRQYGLFHYYGLEHVSQAPSGSETDSDLPVLKDTMYHTIQGDGTDYRIVFK